MQHYSVLPTFNIPGRTPCVGPRHLKNPWWLRLAVRWPSFLKPCNYGALFVRSFVTAAYYIIESSSPLSSDVTRPHRLEMYVGWNDSILLSSLRST